MIVVPPDLLCLAQRATGNGLAFDQGANVTL